jgi:hypothetical protein
MDGKEGKVKDFNTYELSGTTGDGLACQGRFNACVAFSIGFSSLVMAVE